MPCRLRGDLGSELRRARSNQRNASAILVQDVEGPSKLQHDVEIAGVGFVGRLEISQSILHVIRL